MVDFFDNAEEAAFREVVRGFIAEHGEKGRVAGDLEGSTRERLRPWREALVSRGWIAPAWPVEIGGAGLSLRQQFILNQELAEHGLSNVGGLGVNFFGPALLVHGTEEQKREHLGALLRGETVWAQGWSEPSAGSDLASLQTRAIRQGDEYVVNGQKIWTSGAQYADMMYMLARTDPDAPKHRGISLLTFSLRQPGVSVRPLTTMDDRQPFNEVFFEDVHVPASDRVGDENRGWYVGMTVTDFERSSIGSNVGAARRLREIVQIAREQPPQQVPGAANSQWRAQLADRWVEADVSKLFALRIVSMQSAGLIPNYEGSMAKVYLSELNQRIARTALGLYGLYGQLWDADRPEAEAGAAVRGYLGAVSSTIAGGTSEIQRNIVATRGLGLPRG
ncbi:MAG: acyl-CoA dehydrogenase family protein [Dehalococcoidia bacterium]